MPRLIQEFSSLCIEVVPSTKSFSSVIAAISIKPSLGDQIKEAQGGDKFLGKLKERALAGNIKGFSMAEDGALTYEGRLCVPKDETLRRTTLDEAHSTSYSIHPGGTKMYEDLKKQFWWRNMKRSIEDYVEKCMTCQPVKAEHQRPTGMLRPLEIPEWKWENITHGLCGGFAKDDQGSPCNMSDCGQAY